MLIANPIYDVVFKYLMDDSKVAKLLISAIIGAEIIDLDFRPQELTGEAEKIRGHKKNKSQTAITNLTVYRLDFSAKIKTPEGEQLVIIEIQKAKLLNDIMRFRKYLGKQYIAQENSYLIKNKKDKLIRVGIPIISIYFLGEELDNIHGVPVVLVNNQATDLHSGMQIKEKEAFIESLTHKSYIISIPDLNHRRRNELEMLLSIFDQSNIFESHYILNVTEDDFPEKYRAIIRRLQKAISESTMRSQMQIEDDFMSELSEYERMIVDKDNALEESRKQVIDKTKALEESQKQAQEKTKALEESQKQLLTTAENCLKQGLDAETTAKITQLPLQTVVEIAGKLGL